MGQLKGFYFPRTATGQSSIVPPPPWHYSGELLTIEYRTDPDRVIELLPEPLEPADDPGAVALIWADWQSCSDTFEELLDPIRSQYKECFFVVRARHRGELVSRCVYIWVDKDFALARGHFQGYPKKLGSIQMTRPVTVGKAGPRLEPGGRFGATLAAYDRRLAEARFTITGQTDDAGFVNSHAMVHSRYMPSVTPGGPPSLDELVQLKSVGGESGPIYAGDSELELFDAPGEEFALLRPREIIGATWRSVGATFVGGDRVDG
jgi:acetoacetate decarboxylase